MAANVGRPAREYAHNYLRLLSKLFRIIQLQADPEPERTRILDAIRSMVDEFRKMSWADGAELLCALLKDLPEPVRKSAARAALKAAKKIPNDVSRGVALIGLSRVLRRDEPEREIAVQAALEAKYLIKQSPEATRSSLAEKLLNWDDNAAQQDLKFSFEHNDEDNDIERDFIHDTISVADASVDESPQIGQQNEGNLPDAIRNIDQLLDDWLAAKGVAEHARPAFIVKINQIVSPIRRPLWDERENYPHLRHLNAPRFLRAVYPDAIDANGRLTNEEIVRVSDSKLVQIVQGYINKRIERESGLGDAEGLVFTPKDKRGRPKKPKVKGQRRKVPSLV